VTPTVQANTAQIAGVVALQGRSNYSGTTILIDGTPMATTAGDGRFTVFNVDAGIHEVTAYHPGYLSSDDDSVQCQADQTTEMPETTLLGGDTNNDSEINLFDLVTVAAAYRSCSGESAFDSRADLNETGCVDIFDLVLVASNYRRMGPTAWPTIMRVALTISAFSGTYGDEPDLGQSSARNLSDSERWHLWAIGTHNMYGVDVTLVYDPASVTVVDADPKRPGVQIMAGPLFTDRPHLVVENRVTADEDTRVGTVRFAATLLYPAEAINDSGVVVAIPFEPIGPPGRTPSPFTVEDALFVDQRGNRLTVERKANTIRQVVPTDLVITLR
jgi:hypothetical protein